MRIFLVIAGCLLALGLMVVAAGYWWWQENGEALMTAANDGARDGTAQGQAGTGQECYDASVAKGQRCSGLACSTYVHAFAAACLMNASERDGLCDSVPRDPGVVESMQWVAGRCATMGDDASICQGLQQVVLQHCESEDG
jgi:hypothetical protein